MSNVISIETLAQEAYGQKYVKVVVTFEDKKVTAMVPGSYAPDQISVDVIGDTIHIEHNDNVLAYVAVK